MVAMSSNNPEHLNVLLTDRGQRWAAQLPCLLKPQGVRMLRAKCVAKAMEIIRQAPIHLAVIDMGLPLEEQHENQESHGSQGLKASSTQADSCDGGLKLLQVIQRLEERPKAVIAVRGRRFDQRIDDPVLIEALKLDVFTVLDQPVDLEQMLGVFRRVIERFYGGQWPEV